MNKILKIIPIVFGGLSSAMAQVDSSAVGNLVRINGQDHVIVHAFDNPAQYKEFEYNRALMDKAAKHINDIHAKAEAEKNEELKKQLEAQLSTLTSEFEINDQTMWQGYNFSSKNKYTMLFLRSLICVPITEEEFSEMKFKDGSSMDPLKVFGSAKKHFYMKKEVLGFQENQELQSQLMDLFKKRAEMSKLRAALVEIVDVQQVNKISQQIQELEKDIKELSKVLNEKYELSDGSFLEIDKARLLRMLTPEEIIQINSQQKNETKK